MSHHPPIDSTLRKSTNKMMYRLHSYRRERPGPFLLSRGRSVKPTWVYTPHSATPLVLVLDTIFPPSGATLRPPRSESVHPYAAAVVFVVPLARSTIHLTTAGPNMVRNTSLARCSPACETAPCHARTSHASRLLVLRDSVGVYAPAGQQ